MDRMCLILDVVWCLSVHPRHIVLIKQTGLQCGYVRMGQFVAVFGTGLLHVSEPFYIIYKTFELTYIAFLP